MLYEIFLSPQVKRIVIVSNKHGIYELPQRVAERLKVDLRLRKLRSSEKVEILQIGLILRVV